MRVRSVPLAITAAAFLSCSLELFAAAGTPDFTGTWHLDAARSQETNGTVVQLSIQNEGGKMKYERVVREPNGRQLVARFACPVDGTQCDFDENGEKAKVSVWYDGPALVILKTNGPKQDATTERRLDLSPDGQTLTVDFTNLAGNDKPIKLVFTKEAASSAHGQ